MFIKKLVLKGASGAYGMASETKADYQDRKQQRISRSASPNPLGASQSRDEKNKALDDDDSSSESEDEDDDNDNDDDDDDEQEWQLDEAAAELEPPPTYDSIETDKTIDPEKVANNFLNLHQIQPSTQSKEYTPLPAPVILPQRRPKAKQRGFVRAYAPILDEHSGITEAMFMSFLSDFDKASRASPVYDVINIAAFAVGFIPNPIAMGVATAVQFINNTAKEVHSRYTRNVFLNKINDTLFKPRGLYCMIMTYKPNAPPIYGVDITSSDQALVKTLSEPENEFRAKLRNLRLTSGQTAGETSLPPAAPLTYPAIDRYAAQLENDGKEPSTITTTSAFLRSYLDKKAHARYAAANSSNSRLAVPESERSFKSKYADPNHPIHTGTLLGLLSGGRYDPVASKRVRKAERRARKRGLAPLTETEKREAFMGRKIDRTRKPARGPVGLVFKGVRKVMTQDVLYLTVVNLPGESEMREMRQQLEMELEKVKSLGVGNTSWDSFQRSDLR